MAEDKSADAAAPDRRIWPRRAIVRGDRVRPLPPHARLLEDLAFNGADGALVGVDAFMARRGTAGLLVLKDGEVALERYGAGGGPERRRHGYSTAKSLTATLAGAALHDGAIGGLDDRCDHYVPRLLGSAYEGVTLRNVLRMCSGVAWGEENVSQDRSDLWRLDEAMQSGRAGALLDLARAVPRVHPQGAVFNYSTLESCLLGAVVAAATGRPLADYCAEKVWGPAGMGADALWVLESEGGLEMGGFGVSARLRDLGRFGLLMLADGEAVDGQRVLPPGWRDLVGRPDCAATSFGRLWPGNAGGYGYQWWVVPPGSINHGAFSARGAYGQFLFIHPGEQVVIVIQSAWPQSHDAVAEAETVMLIRAAVAALHGG